MEGLAAPVLVNKAVVPAELVAGMMAGVVDKLEERRQCQGMMTLEQDQSLAPGLPGWYRE